MNPKFKFYEVVRIAGNRTELMPVVGRDAAVLGMSQHENAIWFYSVSIIGSGENWFVEESDLLPTGILMTREDFYDGSVVSVSVGPVTDEEGDEEGDEGDTHECDSEDQDRDTHK